MKLTFASLCLLTGLLWPGLPGAEVPASTVTDPATPAVNQIQDELELNLETARWMLAYDQVAWATTDLLLKEPKQALQGVSPVWFCLERDGIWYALYGHNQSNAFEIAVCYRQVSKEKFEKVSPDDFADKDRFARAISLTLPEIQDHTRRTTVRFNYYIRTERDRIAVYYLPAFQTDGKLAYGIQHTFLLDAAGEKLIAHNHYGQVLIGAIPDKNRILRFEMTECAVPTPQAMFAMMSYRDQFADILTHCRDGYFGVVSREGVFACVRMPEPPPDSPGLMP